MKKVLVVASVISMIEWFNKENIYFLKKELNCDVHLAVNLDFMEDTNVDRTVEYIEKLKSMGIVLHNIKFARSPIKLDNFSAYKSLKKIISSYDFDLIHCHTPTASMLTRIASRRTRKIGTTVMYTSHGFHFHKASPKLNWIIYYPIEKWLSKYTDIIVTINQEDYGRLEKFHMITRKYIPGVGVDINKIKSLIVDKNEKKKSIGVPSNGILILSAGELIERKNHQVIIKALGKLKRKDIFYAICGKGPLKNDLIKLARKNNIHDQFILLGFRKDIYELFYAADISALPSRIEGLGLVGIESLSAGIPLIASNVQGIMDYIIDGKNGYCVSPNDVDAFAKKIEILASSNEFRESMKQECIKSVEPYELENALSEMQKIYKEILD